MPTPEINAGALDKRVRLQSPVYNEHNDEIDSWKEVTSVWASVLPATAMEVNEAGREVARTTVPVVIRYRPDVDVRWRIIDGRHTYEIDGLVDVSRRGAQLSLTCKEIS